MPDQFDKPSEGFQIDFLVKLQRLLSEGEFVASYKFALLHAISDLCVEMGNDSRAELPLSTDLITGKFISYYWRQVAPYIPSSNSSNTIVLHQATGKQAEVITLIIQARQQFEGQLASVMRDKQAWESLVSGVRKVVERMPLFKLQTVGREKISFLYGNEFSASHQIRLKPGIAFCFRKFYHLVIDLIESAWVRWIRQLKTNQSVLGQVTDLTEFLFGTDRKNLSLVRPMLIDLQQGQCFYCKGNLKENSAVDHFIPWCRYATDLGHNFVLAHKTCNEAKSDRLAAIPHLGAWWRRNREHRPTLSKNFDHLQILHNLVASETVARWAYQQAEYTGAMVWLKSNELVRIPPDWITSVVGNVDRQ
jgi:5-methylcytosine-specific restriction endonuclease McrA